MLLSDEVKKEIDKINNNRKLSVAEILGLFRNLYYKFLPEIEQLEQREKQQDKLLKEAIEIIKDADYSNRLVKEAKEQFLSKTGAIKRAN